MVLYLISLEGNPMWSVSVRNDLQMALGYVTAICGWGGAGMRSLKGELMLFGENKEKPLLKEHFHRNKKL